MRRQIIAGNWKMNGTLAESEALIRGLLEGLPDGSEASPQVVVCPPFTALAAVGTLIEGTRIRLAAQDMFWKGRGAYTGQISPIMLQDLGCTFVLVGHSEPRGRFGVPEPDFERDILAYFGDSDAAVNRKLLAAFAHGLTPILCVGETLAERKSLETNSIVTKQVIAGLNDLPENHSNDLVIAYEPVWAIGTGEVCPPDEADRVCAVIRATVGGLFGTTATDSVRVLYGGSVKPDNAAELLARPNIDGALVGGASLKSADFCVIISASSRV